MYERGWRRDAILALFLGPSLPGMLVFPVGPIVASFGLSFTNWDPLTPARFVCASNDARMTSDAELWRTLRNTLTFLSGYVPLGTDASAALEPDVTLVLERPKEQGRLQ